MATLDIPQDTLTPLLIFNLFEKSLSIVPKVATVGSFDCNTVNDLINTHSQINASYLINALLTLVS